MDTSPPPLPPPPPTEPMGKQMGGHKFLSIRNTQNSRGLLNPLVDIYPHFRAMNLKDKSLVDVGQVNSGRCIS